jgi:hypothetical protein
MMGTPTFELDEDGIHVWWYHQCAHVGINDDGTVTGGFEITEHDQSMLPRGKEKCWTVVQREPLTLVPSILCLACGTHGFITNGVWVSA